MLTVAKVRAALDGVGVTFVNDIKVEKAWDNKGHTVILECSEYYSVSFEDMSKISEALGTRAINLGSERRKGGYCETCAYSYDVPVLTVMDVKL